MNLESKEQTMAVYIARNAETTFPLMEVRDFPPTLMEQRFMKTNLFVTSAVLLCRNDVSEAQKMPLGGLNNERSGHERSRVECYG